MRKLMLWSIAAALATSSLVVAAEPVVPPPPGGDYSAYSGNPVDLAAREAWLEQRIQLGDANGAISRIEAEHDFDTLGGIRRFHAKKSDEKGGSRARTAPGSSTSSTTSRPSCARNGRRLA
jgi:hypothetical protein